MRETSWKCNVLGNFRVSKMALDLGNAAANLMFVYQFDKQMKAAVKSDYACRAVEALARHYPNTRPLRIEEIATAQSIPAGYLVQILIELKSKGLIRSHRGKAGGYFLARPPSEITVGDVLRAVQGDVLEFPFLRDPSCPNEIKQVWRRIQSAAEAVADQTTFEQICAEADQAVTMYYI